MGVKEILKRLREIFGVSSNKELADRLSVSYNTLNTWIKRDIIPFEVIQTIVTERQLSYDYVLLGKTNKQPDFFPMQSLDIIHIHKIVYAFLAQENAIVELMAEDIFNDSLEEFKDQDVSSLYDANTLDEIVELTKKLPESLDKIEELKREWKQGYIYYYELKTLVKAWGNEIKKSLDEEMEYLFGKHF